MAWVGPPPRPCRTVIWVSDHRAGSTARQRSTTRRTQMRAQAVGGPRGAPPISTGAWGGPFAARNAGATVTAFGRAVRPALPALTEPWSAEHVAQGCGPCLPTTSHEGSVRWCQRWHTEPRLITRRRTSPATCRVLRRAVVTGTDIPAILPRASRANQDALVLGC